MLADHTLLLLVVVFFSLRLRQNSGLSDRGMNTYQVSARRGNIHPLALYACAMIPVCKMRLRCVEMPQECCL